MTPQLLRQRDLVKHLIFWSEILMEIFIHQIYNVEQLTWYWIKISENPPWPWYGYFCQVFLKIVWCWWYRTWGHGRCWFDPWVGKTPWRRPWQPTPGFLPGESYGQRSPTNGLQSLRLQRVRHDWSDIYTHFWKQFYKTESGLNANWFMKSLKMTGSKWLTGTLSLLSCY